jgi:nicotinate-nucleotide pyrophosphorylase
MRARKQIVEFMKTEIESEKFTDAVFDTLQKSDVENKSKNESYNHNIAQSVKQSIKQKSAGILKGTYVSEKVYDQSTKTVRVTVRSSDQDVEAAKRVSRMMGN